MSRVTSVLTLILVAGCASPASGAATRAPAAEPVAPADKTGLLSPEDVIELRYVTDVELSPDGTTVAYTVRASRSDADPPGGSRNEIWLVSRRGGNARRLTNPKDSSWSPRWSPDGATLAFRSKREEGTTQIYRIPLAGGEAVAVTSGASSVNDFEWSPDGKRIAYTTEPLPTAEETAATDAGRDWVIGDVRGEHHQLWTLDVETGLGRPVTERELHVQRFAWSPDGERFALVASDRADVDGTMMYSDLYTVPASGGEARMLTTHSGKLGALEWAPDGANIAFLGAADIHDPTAGILYVVPSAGGMAKPLTERLPLTGQELRWVGDRSVFMLAEQGTKTTLVSVDVASGKHEVLVEDGPICSEMDLDRRGRALVCAGETSAHPAEVFYRVLGRRTAVRVTNSNPWLDTKHLGEQSVVRWKAEDGLELAGVLTKPVGYEEGKRYPLAVLVHGGPEGVSLDGWNTRAGYPAQLFAARGYVVLEPNYRGSRGRGVAFGKADHGDLGGKEFTDVLAGIASLDAAGLVDTSRVGMGGWSYGGYFSGLAATKYSEHFKVAMVAAAITDWISFTGTSEIEHENSLVHWNLWPWDNHALAWDRSPVAHASKSKTATLLVHGDADTRVPPEQATELYRALRHHGVTTEVVFYPREGHGLSERAHQLDFMHRWLDWFDTHLKAPPAAPQ